MTFVEVYPGNNFFLSSAVARNLMAVVKKFFDGKMLSRTFIERLSLIAMLEVCKNFWYFGTICDIMHFGRLAPSRSEAIVMAVSYNKLWKILIDKNMTKTTLCNEARISTNAMAKLGKGQSVRVDVLVKICSTLGCSMDDIMEIIPDNDCEQEGA